MILIKNIFYYFLFCCSFILLHACNKMIDPPVPLTKFPIEIEKILVSKCAVSGCHNDNSFQNAGNLNLSSHNKLFEGGDNGAVVIPFSPDYSSLMQFVNTYDEYGLKATPTMPLNNTSLNRNEVLTIKNWILNGCEDVKGNIPFSENANNRTKVYVTNQGCDVVSVIDAETQLIMRYVKVGVLDNIPEIPHCIRVSADKKYWFVCFADGKYLQKFDAATDRLLESIDIGIGKWNILKIASDNQKVFLSDYSPNGKVIEVNLLTHVIKPYQGAGLFTSPHGIALSKNNDTVYITAQFGNMIYRLIPPLNSLTSISLQKGIAPDNAQSILDPHEIIMNEDFTRYFISCQKSNEIRVMQTGVDTLLKIIPVGIYPLEMVISKNKNLLFVTCQEDENPNLKSKGSVYVIDTKSLQVIKILKENFYQPHGIALDDNNNNLYVISRNVNPDGPAPHHASICGNRNGFFHVIDINTWQVIKESSETAVDPYSTDFR